MLKSLGTTVLEELLYQKQFIASVYSSALYKYYLNYKRHDMKKNGWGIHFILEPQFQLVGYISFHAHDMRMRIWYSICDCHNPYNKSRKIVTRTKEIMMASSLNKLNVLIPVTMLGARDTMGRCSPWLHSILTVLWSSKNVLQADKGDTYCLILIPFQSK